MNRPPWALSTREPYRPLRANPNHYAKGTGKGGQFAPKGTQLLAAIERALTAHWDDQDEQTTTNEVAQALDAIPVGQTVTMQAPAQRSVLKIELARGQDKFKLTAVPADGGEPEQVNEDVQSTAGIVASLLVRDGWLVKPAPKAHGAPTNVKAMLADHDPDTEPLLEPALAAIAKVHEVPSDMRPVPVRGFKPGTVASAGGASATTVANYEFGIDGTPTKVGINENMVTDPKKLNDGYSALVHEIGHYLDAELFGDTPGMMTSEQERGGNTELAPLMAAIEDTPEVQLLLNEARRGVMFMQGPDGQWREARQSKSEADFLAYLTSPRETFARAYNQYIAQRSNDNGLNISVGTEYLQTKQQGMPDQWLPANFKKIAEEFDKLFEAHGLLNRPPLPTSKAAA